VKPICSWVGCIGDHPKWGFRQGCDEGKIAQLLHREGDEDEASATMVALSKHIFGNQAFWIKQRVYSLHSNTSQSTRVGLVLKDGMELLELVSLCIRFQPNVDYGPLERRIC
jgi:hypothetical protein